MCSNRLDIYRHILTCILDFCMFWLTFHDTLISRLSLHEIWILSPDSCQTRHDTVLNAHFTSLFSYSTMRSSRIFEEMSPCMLKNRSCFTINAHFSGRTEQLGNHFQTHDCIVFHTIGLEYGVQNLDHKCDYITIPVVYSSVKYSSDDE